MTVANLWRAHRAPLQTRPVDASPGNAYAVHSIMSQLQDSLLELIRRTSAEIPDDVNQSILASLEQEKKGTIAESALKIIDQNIALAKQQVAADLPGHRQHFVLRGLSGRLRPDHV